MLPWNERIPMLSIHPDAASRDDVAKLATELMVANKQLDNARDCLWGNRASYVKDLEAENKKLKELKCPPIESGDSCICPIEELETMLIKKDELIKELKESISISHSTP